MAKVFTITEGLENLGALKSGGQGSVYKARRTGEIITAIKILPTPISSETAADKNFTSFQNEVEKLRKVNESPNPNVVSIVASGITSSGNLPYIEMEYIEGPDLAELLKEPYDPVFTIKETIKVADHLSNALAHCHRADVKHGDIKSNNVKFNQRTGNYILLDFGLSIMSDEQRRTSIRHAGAIEFMAPEQSNGEMLFETDIYSFGVIMFELLAGSVPFPLLNKGEMARNSVMIAHLESPVPDLLQLRGEVMPDAWGDDKKERQMQVPAWLTGMISKCLEKDPVKRFRTGMELQDFIHAGIIAEESRKAIVPELVTPPPADDTVLRKQLRNMELLAIEREHQVNDLKYQVENKDRELVQLNTELYNRPKRRGIPKAVFVPVLFVALGLSAFNIYHSYVKPYNDSLVNTPAQLNSKTGKSVDSLLHKSRPVKKAKKTKRKSAVPATNENIAAVSKPKSPERPAAIDARPPVHKYKVRNYAFFYEHPDWNTRNNYYTTVSDATLTALREKDDFIYVEFTSRQGRNTRGWLAKKDLSPIYE